MTYQFNPAPAGYGVNFSFLAPTAPHSETEPDPFAIEQSSDSEMSDAAPPRSPEGPNSAENRLGGLMTGTKQNEAVRRRPATKSDSDGHRNDPPHAEQAFDPNRPPKVCACAVSGPLLALVTLIPGQSSWRLVQGASRMFHLGGCSQEDRRKFAREIYNFVTSEEVQEIAFCRTKTGSWTEGLEDEVIIESLIMMIPQLAIHPVDNNSVADWVIDMNPPSLENMPNARQGFAQIRALEAAQYVIAQSSQI
jgi:hypothetical protein